MFKLAFIQLKSETKRCQQFRQTNIPDVASSPANNRDHPSLRQRS